MSGLEPEVDLDHDGHAASRAPLGALVSRRNFLRSFDCELVTVRPRRNQLVPSTLTAPARQLAISRRAVFTLPTWILPGYLAHHGAIAASFHPSDPPRKSRQSSSGTSPNVMPSCT